MFTEHLMILVKTSDQSIIGRRGILMQILLVAGLKIVLLTSKHTVTNFMSVRGGLYKSTGANSYYRPRLDAAKEFITDDAWNRGSE